MKKILFVTHQLTRTGAPQVLLDLIRVCINQGHAAMVISLSDGEARSEWEAAGLNVTIMPHLFAASEQMVPIFKKFDLVFVNTLVCYGAIPICVQANVNTVWWIHEHEGYFDHYRDVLPRESDLGERVRVLGVSPVTQELLREKAGYKKAGLLPFSVPDHAGALGAIKKKRPVTFVCVALYAYVKGQDILCKAIERLPEHSRRECRFFFYGNRENVDPDVYGPVEDAVSRYEEVSCQDAVAHAEMLRIIGEADYLIVPSRKEPMPTVAVEAMMMGTPCIISDICGITHYLKDGKDAVFFRSESVESLAGQIEKALVMPDDERYTEMAAAARLVYEREFTTAVFEERVRELVIG